ncbi:DNA replication complex GINS protein psf-3 [Neurospora tetrasperma FGSC 2508]|uniref:DNA replication complex GINS protein PSF3 n=1 Tax=Neurospora tetrasperma (strain FGSC 2508 / ATCC MYA-4615 / P0657) TaxID=510951 RepID=F8MXU4_NEUT8|nr:DNA replication complex GINS protein psf-3 [Neurospora tetrasperma FGSC 2508]EGO53879.1 DNA replication complex GINS protein psf-3 [Neurospora tetrasperma FGSC 2508]EGZ72565.1 DNA replication complex GINS protein psf-3 [Neurospora tetrasperma FGSC 2509]
MSYYDIDAILTDAEKIPCTFQIDVPDLGYLDNQPGHTLKSGSRVALPIWLAEMLAIANTGTIDMDDPSQSSKSFITFDLPPALGNDVVQALKADPRSVPLRDQSAHFYALATHMMELSEEPELSAVLRKTFVSRAAEIALHARKVGGAGGKGKGKATKDDNASNLGVGGAGEDFLRGLDEWERKLFRCAHDGTKASKEWMENVKKR